MRIGIAGFIGSGKSAVANFVANRGFPVISADEEAHVLYRENAKVREQLAKTFGAGILTEQGVDRFKLGSLVFENPSALAKLEGIIHPVLADHLFQKLKETNRHLFLEGALLPRWPDLLSHLDQVWLVEANPLLRLHRIMARGLSEIDARRRMTQQEEFPTMNHPHLITISNEKSLEDLQAQVERVLNTQLQ